MDSDELYNREARSALRHRPSFTGAAAAMTEESQPQPLIQRASRMRNTTTDETRQTQGAPKETTETFRSPPTRSGARTEPDPFEKEKQRSPISRRFQSFSRRTRMVAIFMASIIVTLLLVFLYQQVTNIVTTTLDDQRYGRPRTFQVDAFVGHERGKNPSHFIAINLQGHIEIIELPGGHAADVHEYSVPQRLVGPNADLVPPTLQFVDTNRPGIKDMILRAGDIQVHFTNDANAFQLPSS
jgi:hypothetical protein